MFTVLEKQTIRKTYFNMEPFRTTIDKIQVSKYISIYLGLQNVILTHTLKEFYVVKLGF